MTNKELGYCNLKYVISAHHVHFADGVERCDRYIHPDIQRVALMHTHKKKKLKEEEDVIQKTLMALFFAHFTIRIFFIST